jgi:hypothetical protein
MKKGSSTSNGAERLARWRNQKSQEQKQQRREKEMKRSRAKRELESSTTEQNVHELESSKTEQNAIQRALYMEQYPNSPLLVEQKPPFKNTAVQVDDNEHDDVEEMWDCDEQQTPYSKPCSSNTATAVEGIPRRNSKDVAQVVKKTRRSTPQYRAVRNAQLKTNRANETPQQKEERCDDIQAKKKDKRANETPQQTEERCENI